MSTSRSNTRLDDNQIQLDKARQAVANVIWFFNNQEFRHAPLKSKIPKSMANGLPKQKKNGIIFSHNRGGVFRAPDQPLNTSVRKDL